MITTEDKDIVKNVNMPVCRYTLRRGSRNGPIIKYTEVGSRIFHLWDCEECKETKNLIFEDRAAARRGARGARGA